MSLSRWQTVSQIFEAALDLPPNERDHFVHNACGGNLELESEVIRLIVADEHAGSFLDRPALSTLPAQNRLAAPPLLNAGSMIAGRFQVVRFIGQGGMGQVYEALDLELKSRIALKAIRPEIASDPRVLSRFRREVQLTRIITHPNVCRTFDIERHSQSSDGEINGVGDLTFLTMELLEGETLASLIRRHGRCSTAEALPIVLQMIDALAAAHAVGVIHRDFKPSNVVMVRGVAKTVASASGSSTVGLTESASGDPSFGPPLRAVVTDFGLARIVAPDMPLETGAMVHSTSLTGDQALMGTLVYMAPEQFERGDASMASDIYSLGLVMFEMVTGQRPFADDIPLAEATKRLKQPAPLASSLIPKIPAAWDAAISRCLALDPPDRFETVQQVAEVLHGPSTATGSRPEVDTVVEPRRDHPAQTRKILAAVALVAMVVSLLVTGLRLYVRRQGPIRFAERDWILVTDFNNQTGERLFDRVVRDLVVQSLSQSSYVNIVPRLSALEAAKRTGVRDVGSIDEKLGRELFLHENYKALLSGNIFKNGSRYTIAMRVEVPGQDSSSMSGTETIQSPDELFAAVDRLTVRIRRTLGEPLSKIETNTKPLAQVTTNSLEALQRYSTAVDLYGQGKYERCIALANDAVEMDANFAMAHLLLGEAYEQLGNENKSHSQVELARAALDHVGERERHLILAVGYSYELANEKAAEEYQHLLDVYPDDVEALKGFASEAFWGGGEVQAITAQQRATALNPDDIDCYDTLMALLVRTNRFAEALSVYSKADARHLRGPDLDFLRGVATWGNGDAYGAKEIFRGLTNEGANWKIVGTLYLGKLSAFQGQMAESITLFKTGLALVQSPDLEYWMPAFQYQIARAAIVKGNGTSKSQCARLKATVAKAPTPSNLQRAGSLSLQVGDLNAAKVVAAVMERQVAAHPDAFSQMEAHSLNGDIALAQGHASEAIQEQRTAITFRQWYKPSLSLGDACAAVSDWKCAIDAYTKYLEFKGEIFRDDVGEDWVLAHYSLARAYLLAGDSAAAEQRYQEFLSLFGSADPDLPVLKDARREMHH